MRIPDGYIPIIHDKGQYACKGVAFYYLETMKKPGRPVQVEYAMLPDGTRPKAGEKTLCATCGKPIAL